MHIYLIHILLLLLLLLLLVLYELWVWCVYNHTYICALTTHLQVKAYYRSLGYSEESEHRDDATVTTTLSDFCDIYREHLVVNGGGSKGVRCRGSPVEAEGGGGDNVWITKKSAMGGTGGAYSSSFSPASAIPNPSSSSCGRGGGTGSDRSSPGGKFSSSAYDDFMEYRHAEEGRASSLASETGRHGGGTVPPVSNECTERITVGISTQGDGVGGAITGKKRDIMSADLLDELGAGVHRRPSSLTHGIDSATMNGETWRRDKSTTSQKRQDGGGDTVGVSSKNTETVKKKAPALAMCMRDFFPSKRNEPRSAAVPHQHHTPSSSSHQQYNIETRQWLPGRLTTAAHMKSCDPTVRVDLTVSEHGDADHECATKWTHTTAGSSSSSSGRGTMQMQAASQNSSKGVPRPKQAYRPPYKTSYQTAGRGTDVRGSSVANPYARMQSSVPSGQSGSSAAGVSSDTSNVSSGGRGKEEVELTAAQLK